MNVLKRIAEQTEGLIQHSHLQFFPLWTHLRNYSSESMRGDLRAGFNVALLALPQGMAYAAIAGLPIQYGIYGSAIAALVGPLWSGSRWIILGPTNATSAMLLATFLSAGLATEASKIAALPIVLLMSGLFLVLGAFLKVANLIQYVSRSVVAGYITAAAIYIIANQLRKVVGVEIELSAGSNVVSVITETLRSLPSAHLPTVFLSLLTVAIYVLLKQTRRNLPHVAITLILASGINYALERMGAYSAWNGSIEKTSSVDASQWVVVTPELRLDWLNQFASVSLIIAFLCVLEGISIGKTLAARAGQRLDANQEMLGMGLANLACAVYQGMPSSGSLTRSQLNYSSGATTPLASILCGLVCAIAAYTLGPLTAFVPVSTLGVLVIAIGISLINRHVLRVVWHATQADRIVLSTTFLAAVFTRLDFAIILGAVVSILLFLRKAAQPELIEYMQDESGEVRPRELGAKDETAEVSIVHVEGNLFFGAAELFRDQMRRVCEKPNLKIVILKMRNAHHLDATSILSLEELLQYMKENDRTLLTSELRDRTIRVFRASGLSTLIGEDNMFADDPANPTLSTSKAIRRSMQILDGQQADVKIFLGGSKKQETPPEP